MPSAAAVLVTSGDTDNASLQGEPAREVADAGCSVDADSAYDACVQSDVRSHVENGAVTGDTASSTSIHAQMVRIIAALNSPCR